MNISNNKYLSINVYFNFSSVRYRTTRGDVMEILKCLETRRNLYCRKRAINIISQQFSPSMLKRAIKL